MYRTACFGFGLTTILTAAASAAVQSAGQQFTIREAPLPDGFSYTTANDINAQGEAVGAAGGPAGTESIMYVGGRVAMLDSIGGMHSFADAINEAGQIAGASQSQPWWGWKAVRWETDGTMTIVAPLTGDEHDNAYAYGINNLGQMAGQSDTDNGYWRAFFWDERTGIVDLGTLGGAYSGAKDINDPGVVVGWSWGQISTQQAFVWEGDGMIALSTLLGAEFPGSVAHAINNHGVIAGESNGETYGIIHAVTWDAKREVHALGSLGGFWSRAYDINDAGVIVGAAQVKSGETHAFIYRNGAMQDLNDLLLQSNADRVLERAVGISEEGHIVGLGTLNGQPRGFILDPVRLRLSN